MTTNYKLPEPVALFHGTIDCGEHGATNLEIFKVLHRGQELYSRTQLLAAYEAGKAENKQWKDTRYKELSSIANGATIRAESEMVEKNDARRKLITQAEALKLAKEALEHSLEFQGPHRQVVNEALAAINALENSNG